MKEMFEASVDGQPYDAEKWSQYFRPAGMAQRTGDPVNATAKPQPAPAMEATVAPVATAPAPQPAPTQASTDNKAEDILAMIRARQQK